MNSNKIKFYYYETLGDNIAITYKKQKKDKYWVYFVLNEIPFRVRDIPISDFSHNVV